MMLRIVLSLALVAGCFRSNGEFHCESDTECVNHGVGGRCELVGFCSFPDPACAGGSRFGDFAGSLSGSCVGDTGGDAGVDTPDTPDAMVVAPTFVVAANDRKKGVDGLTYPLDIPQSTNRFLLISVQLASDCSEPSATVTSVTYDGVSATQIMSLLGTPCGADTTRSEQWGLVAPSVGLHDVVVTLSGANTFSVHSGAMVFAGVDQTNPVRGSATASGRGTESTVTIASTTTDLVVNTVGQGNGITQPGLGQTIRFLQNVSTGDTLDNSGGSSAPGAASVDMTWTFNSTDEWQTISSSLRPPGG